MAVSEVVQYAFVFALTLVFSVFAIIMRDPEDLHWRVFFKVGAGLLWVVFAIIHFISGDVTSVLTPVLSLLWVIFGFIFFFSLLLDWDQKKQGYQKKREMGVFD